MAIKPILFNTDMVRALLDGRKTATRRVVKPQPVRLSAERFNVFADGTAELGNAGYFSIDGRKIKPRYLPGDILYVRETWLGVPEYMTGPFPDPQKRPIERWHYFYLADETYKNPDDKWRPSIHMPREAARIFLRATDVRVERLQDIDDEGVVAEGLKIGDPFDELWDSTIKPADRGIYGWETNPWVWVIEFERCGKPEGWPC